MDVRFKLLIPVDVIPGYEVEGNRVLVSLLVCAVSGNIFSCVCSLGYRTVCSSVRLTATAFNGAVAAHWVLRPLDLFSPCNIIVGGPATGPSRGIDYWYFNFSKESIESDVTRRCRHRWEEMFLYFFYDRPLDSYLFDPEINNLSMLLFRRVLLSALLKYSSWLRGIGMG